MDSCCPCVPLCILEFGRKLTLGGQQARETPSSETSTLIIPNSLLLCLRQDLFLARRGGEEPVYVVNTITDSL